MKNKFTFLNVTAIILLVLAALFAVTYMFAPDIAPAQQYRVGICAPFSGGYAGGESIKRGVLLAMNDHGRSNIELFFEDSVCEPAKAVEAANRLISDYQVDAIIGDVCSGATLAIAPIANRLEVPVISPGSTNPDISRAGGYVFRTVPSDTEQGSYGAAIAIDQGATRLAIIHYSNPYSLGFLDSMTENFEQLGGQIVSVQAIDPADPEDFTEAVASLDLSAIDGIYLIGNKPPILAEQVMELRKSVGPKIPIFGTEAMTSSTFTEAVDPNTANLIVSAFPSGSAEFQERFRQEYNVNVPLWAANAYDAMTALIRAFDTAEQTGLNLKVALANVDFQGVTGRIVFDAQGDVAGNYITLHLKDGSFRPMTK